MTCKSCQNDISLNENNVGKWVEFRNERQCVEMSCLMTRKKLKNGGTQKWAERKKIKKTE